MVSHVDHTEQTYTSSSPNGVSRNLRGWRRARRAQKIIDNCAHPDYRPMLQDYFDRASATAPGKHTPHMIEEALSWHAPLPT